VQRRATSPDEEPVVVTAHFTIDLAAKRASVAGDDVHLTPKEWQLVELLVRNPGKLVSQRQVLREVWGPQYVKETDYLRVFIAAVRRKLEPEPSRPRYFLTEPGMGYRFEPDPS
jgi:two-component system KDP operon response regulator KdpE